MSEEQKMNGSENKETENGIADQGEQPSESEEDRKPENKTAKTVASILQRVKNDSEMTSEEKIDTLSMLLGKFVEENGV